MNKITISFFLCFLSGMLTLIGILPIFFKVKNHNKFISYSLSFASGIMIGTSLFDLTKESFLLLNKFYSKYFTVFIIILFILIGLKLTSIINKSIKTNNSLYKIGVLSMISLIIHNVPEGIITFLTTTTNFKLGLSICIAIALHNIPEGISISLPIYYSTKNKHKAIFYTLIASLSEPFGALLCYIFLYKFIDINILGYLYALVTGIMLYLSLFSFLKEASNYNNNKNYLKYFVLGFLIIFFKSLLY